MTTTATTRDPFGVRRHCGFTLLEALMAAGVLLVIVVAVTSAITAGQQHAQEAQFRIAATLAAEELMGRLTAVDYDTLASWHGYTEDCGTMTKLGGDAFPANFSGVGRSVEVTQSLETVPGTGVRVVGRTIRIRAFDELDRTLAELRRFVPQPPADSLPPPDEGGETGEDDDGGLIEELLDGLGL